MTRELPDRFPAVARNQINRVGRAVFGDRVGLVIFLAGLAFVTTYWRVGIFITDTYAIGNTLVNLADGSLAIKRLQDSLTLGSQPGLYFHDGAVYGRNYGHAYVSLPVLWLLDALSGIFDLRLVLAAGVSLLWIALFEQCGRVLGRHRQGVTAGSLIGVAVFLSNAFVAAPLAEKWYPIVALQTTTMIAAALVGVVLYRLLSHLYGRYVGFGIGLATVIATPVGFWASIPKRHVISALAVTVVVAAFYHARAVDSRRSALAARALSYATIALFAWVHAPEALVLLFVLGPLDLVTARSNHPRRLVVVGLVFLVALTPFMLTNHAISGNPMQPPRTFVGYYDQVDLVETDSGSTGPIETGNETGLGGETADQGGGTDAESRVVDQTTPQPNTTVAGPPTNTTNTTTAGQDRSSPEPTGTADGEGAGGDSSSFGIIGTLISLLSAIFDSAIAALQRAKTEFDKGFAVVTDPSRLYHLLIRSGRASEYVTYSINQQEAIELSVLETLPLLGALLSAIPAGFKRLSGGLTIRELRDAAARPERQTDVLTLGIVAMFSLIYLPRLPGNTQITVRYLVPIMPLGMYGIARLVTVRSGVRSDWRSLVGSYLGTLFVGGVSLFAAHNWLALTLGEAMQLHALLGLASAILLAIWSIAALFGTFPERYDAIVLTLPAALTTLFLLFTGLFYFQYADHALPLVRALTELIPISV